MSAYPACKCELCQVGIKSIKEQYAYHYAKYHSAKFVIEQLYKAGIQWHLSGDEESVNEPINWLGCYMDDQLASGLFLQELEEKNPELKNWIIKDKKD